MPKTKETKLTPNYDRMFRLMLQEAKNQSEPVSIFRGLPAAKQAIALRALQRFLAPLSIAACSMTTVQALEEFRTVIGDIVTGVDVMAAQLECGPAAEDDQL